MKFILVAAALLVSTAANAEIICTQHSGCFETGLKILNHGGAYGGLTYTNNREMKTDARGYPVRNKPARIVREHW